MNVTDAAISLNVADPAASADFLKQQFDSRSPWRRMGLYR